MWKASDMSWSALSMAHDMPGNEHLLITPYLQRTCLDNMTEVFFCFIALLFCVVKEKKKTSFCITSAWASLEMEVCIIVLSSGFVSKGLYLWEVLLLQANSPNLDGFLLADGTGRWYAALETQLCCSAKDADHSDFWITAVISGQPPVSKREENLNTTCTWSKSHLSPCQLRSYS